METRYPIEGQFSSEFPVICNHCGAAIFCVFLEKRPHTVKCSKFCSNSFHHLTNRRCCVQMS